MSAATYEARVRAWSSTARWRAEAGAFLDVLALPSGAEVLDVGAGAGALHPLLAARGVTAFGVDRWTGWSMIPQGTRLVRADACRLPFRPATFDAVLIHHVLAHLADPARALAEARRVLRPGGRLGVVTPNARFVRALFLPSLVNGHRKDETVVKHATLPALRGVVADAGFRIVHARTWGKPAWTCPIDAFRERLFLVAEAPA
jgi:ubiquinone/menaquinone biosynthesis C-methylase UbiE